MVDFTLLVLLAGRGHLCGYNASFASHHIHFSHLGNLIEQFLHMTPAELYTLLKINGNWKNSQYTVYSFKKSMISNMMIT